MTKPAPSNNKEALFEWEGKDRNGKMVRGETRAMGENQVQASLRRQGILPTKIKRSAFLVERKSPQRFGKFSPGNYQQ